jgi:SAM-dependent methyltransferase
MVFKINLKIGSGFKNKHQILANSSSRRNLGSRKIQSKKTIQLPNQSSKSNSEGRFSQKRKLPDEIWNVLRCPYCRSELARTANGAECLKCHDKYPLSPNGQLDLRLRRPKKYSMVFDVDNKSPSKCAVIDNLSINPQLKKDCPGKGSGCISPELLSYFPEANNSNSLMLDLGCGSTPNKHDAEKAGFKYIGLDFSSSKSTILGDAHALPFEDETFEFVLSIAVLEHLRYPFIALSEVNRVLKKKSAFIGSVAFLEPFHGNSYYHFTHLGIINALESSAFKIKLISTNPKWNSLTAQARMGLFPRMPRALIQIILAPPQIVHSIWWKAAKTLYPTEAKKNKNSINFAGSFMFIAEKSEN